MIATARHGGRGGAFMAAVWLIGLGVVFLIQQAWDLPWSQAWPMFLILAGIASLASTAVHSRSFGHAFFGLPWGLLMVVAGIVFLLSTTGNLGVGIGELFGRWWPVALIAIGAWFLVGAVLPWNRASASSGELSLALDGAQSASVRVRFGGGELSIGPAPSGSLLSGSWDELPPRVERAGGSVEIRAERPYGAAPWVDRVPHWDLGLSTEVPLELRLDSGAAKTRLDLAEHQLRSLRINTGASDTRVVLPRGAGETQVRADGGAASLVLEVPAGVAARIRSRMALGSTQVDTARFPRTADGWESPDYAAAANRVEIQIQGGVGSARVVSG